MDSHFAAQLRCAIQDAEAQLAQPALGRLDRAMGAWALSLARARLALLEAPPPPYRSPAQMLERLAAAGVAVTVIA